MPPPIIHELQGKLASLSHTSRVPTNITAIKMRAIEKREIDVYILDTNEHKEKAISSILVWACSRLTSNEDGEIPTTSEALAGVLSGILTLSGLKISQTTGNLVEALGLAGYKMSVYSVSMAMVKSQLSDTYVDAFFDKVGGDENIFEDDVKPALALFCVVLMSVSKQINPEGFSKWYEKRISGFINALGGAANTAVMAATQFLDASSMHFLNNLFSSAFELRRTIFRIIVGLSMNPGTYSKVFRDLLTLCEYTEMTHIVMIDRYLYDKYPEILAMRCLSSEISPMRAAWSYLSTLSSSDVPFTRLLMTREDSACLNRNNFPLFIAAATAAASFETPSFGNYKMGTNPSADMVTTMVKLYLTKRQELAVLAMGDDKNSRMSDRVSTQFFALLAEAEETSSTDEIQRT